MGNLAGAITATFGLDALKEKMNAGVGCFGLGVAGLQGWQARGGQHCKPGHPTRVGRECLRARVLQNLQPKYLKAWWNVVNWDPAQANYSK
jgi:hypothetical protein